MGWNGMPIGLLVLLVSGMPVLAQGRETPAIDPVTQRTIGIPHHQIKQEQMNQIGEASTKGLQLLQNGDERSLKAAIAQFENALRYAQDIQGKEAQMFNAATLRTIGTIHLKLTDQKSAFTSFSRALTIFHDLQAYGYEAEMLNNIGYIYKAWGEHQKAIESFEQSFKIYQLANHVDGMVTALNNLGHVYDELGNLKKSIEFLNRALRMSKSVDNPTVTSAILNNLGHAYFMLRDYKEALGLYKQALLLRPVNAYNDIATTLNNIGYVYQEQKKWNDALESFEQSFSFYSRANNSPGQATALNSLGLTHARLGETEKALIFYNKALSLWKNSPSGKAKVLNNISISLVEKGDTNSAIAFYKLSINSFERLRQSINRLPRSEQEIYTQTIRFAYTNLATLLLEQNRLSEAQCVIELLKLRELKELNPIASNRLAPNQSMPISDREKQSIAQINPEIAREITPTNLSQPDRLSPTNPLNQSAQDLLTAQPNAALIYQLFTQDKLWLILITPDGKLQRFASTANQAKIESLTAQFRQQIEQCEQPNYICDKTDTQALNQTSQQLYQQLFPPDLQTALKAAKPQHLILALDGSLRNIPMAALDTGKQYLIEQYTLSSIIAAQLTDSQDKLPSNPAQSPLLAVGVSRPATISVPDYVDADRQDQYAGLGNVPIELNAVTSSTGKSPGAFPGHQLLNDQFTLASLRQQLPQHRLFHIGSHGIFRPNFLDYSYILMGNNQPWSITQMDTEANGKLFQNIHMVTLSACQSGLSGRDKTGIEIAGMSHAFLSQGAKTVTASLWKVNDESTAILMQRFYQNLAKTPNQSKTESLHQAQLHLLKTPRQILIDELRGSADFRPIASPASPTKPQLAAKTADYTHPYYWASFTLIGNSR